MTVKPRMLSAAGLGAALAITSLALPPNAHATCTTWGLRFPVYIDQSNGWVTRLDGRFVATSIHDGREIEYGETWLWDKYSPGQPVKFEVKFPASHVVGVFEGHIDDSGFVSGTTFDKTHPESRADWHMREPANCDSLDGGPGRFDQW